MIRIKKNCPIAGFSTFRIGGRAEYFCEVKDFKEFLEAVQASEKLGAPYKILAGGSNVVFPDGVLKGFLIKINRFSQPLIKVSGLKIEADAGVGLMKLIRIAIQNGLKGLETLSGIPGTVGGAIAGNAGAYGRSISEILEKVEVWDGRKKFWLKNKDCGFKYRHSIFSSGGGSASGGKERPYVALRAVLKFGKGNPAELKKISENIISVRQKKYPPGLRCPGSFFKNVLISEVSRKSLRLIDKNKIIENKIPAGYLLERVGAKGMRLGDVRIADFHGNLLINNGSATAKDVRKLANILKSKVRKKFGINLDEEIRYF